MSLCQTCAPKTRKYHCDLCRRGFNKNNQLEEHKRRYHKRRIHSAERPFKCEWEGCGYTFETSRQRSKHTRRTHTAERPFKCGFCRDSLRSKDELYNHICKLHKNRLSMEQMYDMLEYFQNNISK